MTGGSLVGFSRRAAASQELAIQVGTPNLGRTHFITTKYAASKMAKGSHAVMNSTLIEMQLPEIGDTGRPHFALRGRRTAAFAARRARGSGQLQIARTSSASTAGASARVGGAVGDSRWTTLDRACQGANVSSHCVADGAVRSTRGRNNRRSSHFRWLRRGMPASGVTTGWRAYARRG